MNDVLLGVLSGAVLACAVSYLILRRRVLEPLQKLRCLTEHIDELSAGELSVQAEGIAGIPGAAARTIAQFAESAAADVTGIGAGNSPAEYGYKMRVVDEICKSLLPQALRENDAGGNFALAGDLQEGKRRNCDFYDYFFLDTNTLCVVVGQVPGNGIAESLFAVVTQTTIRSRLRLGRTLVETMSDVNEHLYDLGGRNSACVLVGVLNTMNGRFSFVNAGGTIPFLMRSEETFEWLKTPIYAPLGANESVTYRPETLRLNQGDRLFFYSADLGELLNREKQSFGDQELQSALNRSRSKTHNMEELLRFVQNEGASFCEHGGDVLCSAAIALEYQKGNREYVYTLIRGVPECASELTEFMRRKLEENGIAPKDRARHILLGDELFALCCRACTGETDIKAELAILTEENTLHLRMFAPMGGNDPLVSSGITSGVNAAAYIRTHTRRAAFEAGIERDMIEIVSDLE